MATKTIETHSRSSVPATMQAVVGGLVQSSFYFTIGRPGGAIPESQPLFYRNHSSHVTIAVTVAILVLVPDFASSKTSRIAYDVDHRVAPSRHYLSAFTAYPLIFNLLEQIAGTHGFSNSLELEPRSVRRRLVSFFLLNDF